MARIDRQRREHWKNLLLKITARPDGALGVSSATSRIQIPFLANSGTSSFFQSAYCVATSCRTTCRMLLKVSVGLNPVRPYVAGLAFDLLFDSSDANLEKLIEIRAENGEKFHPLEQRLGRVLRLFQDAAVKFEPAQLAIDEILVGGEFWLFNRPPEMGAIGLRDPSFKTRQSLAPLRCS